MLSPSLVFGAASALSGMMGTFGKYNQEAAQAAAVNKQRADQYKYQLSQVEREGINRANIYRQKLSQYGQKDREYQRAYGRGLEDSQAQLNETYAQARFSTLNQQISLAQQMGAAQARGRGVSANRAGAMAMADYGRGQALTMDNLLRARYATTRTNERLRDQLISAQRQSYADVALKPMMPIAPPKPVFQSGPSQMSLLSGLATNALSGVSAGLGFKEDIGAGNDSWDKIFS